MKHAKRLLEVEKYKENKFEIDRQQELFNYLVNELGVIALQTQMHDIEAIILKMQNNGK